MRSLFREVMLPSIASVGFLFALAVPPVEAQEVTAETRPEVTLASTRPVASVGIDESGSGASVAPEATRRSTMAHCERVERFAWFTIRHWE